MHRINICNKKKGPICGFGRQTPFVLELLVRGAQLVSFVKNDLFYGKLSHFTPQAMQMPTVFFCIIWIAREKLCRVRPFKSIL